MSTPLPPEAAAATGGAHQSELIAQDILAYLKEHEQKDLLRFLTCGSVDDGKSTLIGRLLHDSKMVYEDQLAAIHEDSQNKGSAGGKVDLSLLMDGLKAEREQGITIDVAYRYFSTSRRKFIIADTPGHEQYTRNMVTGASTAQLAIILVDARKGVQVQTRRHSYLVSLLGIRHVVVAINKMDLVDWSQQRYEEIREEYLSLAKGLRIVDPTFIPLSALLGDGVVDKGEHMPWYDGPALMEHLETVELGADTTKRYFRFPVQYVIRPDLDFRGFAGTVASGEVRRGDTISVLPSGRSSTIERIVTFDGDLERAIAGQAVTLTLADEVDVSRGDLIVRPDAKPIRASEIDAEVVWMAEDELVPGKDYLIRQATATTTGRVTAVQHRVDLAELENVPAPTLGLNEIGRCSIALDEDLLFDPYRNNRKTGAFIVIDRVTNATVGAGMVVERTSAWTSDPKADLQRQRSEITSDERAARYGQKPATVLLTGLTGAGKSTIAKAVERRLFDRGRPTVRLDGENLRLGLSRDLGFSFAERSEQLRRAAEFASLVNRQGLICVLALNSPEREPRQRAKELIGPERFIEVFVDVPLEAARLRDAKGLYEAAERGDIKNFPGLTAPYEEPLDPDLVLATAELDVQACVDQIIEVLVERGFLPGAA